MSIFLPSSSPASHLVVSSNHPHRHRLPTTLRKQRTVVDCGRKIGPAVSARTDSVGLSCSPLGIANRFRCNDLFLRNEKNVRKVRGGNVVCSSVAALTPLNLQWISTASSLVLMLIKGTPIQKAFLVPFFALQAPFSVISWITGEQGTWTAFVALLVRLFFFIPGELELPFQAMLLLIVAPYQTINIRGKPVGAITSFAIAAYLAYQHFSKMGSLRKAFDQGSIVATLALVCIVSVSCLLLF